MKADSSTPSEGAVARAVLRFTPRWTRTEAAEMLGVSISRMHSICRELADGSKKLSDWDIEQLRGRHRTPGRVKRRDAHQYTWAQFPDIRGRNSLKTDKEPRQRMRQAAALMFSELFDLPESYGEGVEEVQHDRHGEDEAGA